MESGNEGRAGAGGQVVVLRASESGWARAAGRAKDAYSHGSAEPQLLAYGASGKEQLGAFTVARTISATPRSPIQPPGPANGSQQANLMDTCTHGQHPEPKPHLGAQSPVPCVTQPPQGAVRGFKKEAFSFLRAELGAGPEPPRRLLGIRGLTVPAFDSL